MPLSRTIYQPQCQPLLESSPSKKTTKTTNKNKDDNESDGERADLAPNHRCRRIFSGQIRNLGYFTECPQTSKGRSYYRAPQIGRYSNVYQYHQRSKQQEKKSTKIIFDEYEEEDSSRWGSVDVMPSSPTYQVMTSNKYDYDKYYWPTNC